MGRLDGKVVFITGVARGQGRSHAVRVAEEGADVIGVDICKQVESGPFPLADEEDMAVTVGQVEALGRRIVARVADVRDLAALESAVGDGVERLGRLDGVVANAGICSYDSVEDMSEQKWADVIDINLSGVWRTAKVAIPHLDDGSAIAIAGSTGSVRGMPNIAHYVASKHGVIGLMRALAHELAPRMIRVNTVLPTSVNTPMFQNESTYKLFRPDLENPTAADSMERATEINLMPISEVEPVDIANAVLFLLSDESRYITGAALPVDAGSLLK